MRRRPLLAGLAALFLVLAPVAAYGTAPPAVDPDAAVADPGDGATGPDDGDLVSFGIAPSGRERPDDRPFIIVSAPPGATIYENVAVINLDSRPLTLDVYTGDFLMAEGGGLAVTTRDQPPTGIGSWIAIQTPASVTVPAQTAETGYGFTVVPLVISIPDNAQPGDHLGGVVAALVSAGEGGVNTPDLELEQRVAARVYIRGDGEL
ncbi:MAG TPA: hypothetical protein PKB06_10915, partial [Actinotalea sp.]|nr:hypothetical protein [Actinotalea sp.]